jgi:DNA-binding CsgD family transcriptional regulator
MNYERSRRSVEMAALIFEAARRPERWIHFLERLVDFGPFDAGLLIVGAARSGEPVFVETHQADPGLLQSYTDYVKEIKPFGPSGAAECGPVQRVVLLPTSSAADESAMHGIGVFVSAAGGCRYSLGVWRCRQGPAYTSEMLEFFDVLAGHLRRVAALQQCCEAVRAERDLALDVLDRLPLGVVIVDANLRILCASRTAELLLAREDCLSGRGQRLRAKNARDDARLQALVHETLAATGLADAPAGNVLAFQREAGGRPLLIAGIPDPGAPAVSRDGTPGRIALVISDGESHAVPSVCKLRALYELTPAEAELTSLLVAGQSLEDAARERRIRIGTARAQLKSVFAKTDTHRQAELIRLLAATPILHLDTRSALPPRDERTMGGTPFGGCESPTH